jgi:hypothetical protein
MTCSLLSSASCLRARHGNWPNFTGTHWHPSSIKKIIKKNKKYWYKYMYAQCVQVLAPAAGPGPHPKHPSPGSTHGESDKLSRESWPSGCRCHPSPPIPTPGSHACPGCGLAASKRPRTVPTLSMYVRSIGRAAPTFNITPVEPPRSGTLHTVPSQRLTDEQTHKPV